MGRMSPVKNDKNFIWYTFRDMFVTLSASRCRYDRFGNGSDETRITLKDAEKAFHEYLNS